MTSDKQVIANRRNARKGGVKTEEGKAIVKYNALKHGLLAKEVVITVGEGAERPEEFANLLDDLQGQLGVVGPIEEMLLEKIAVAYWRLRRAQRYEVGLIRNKLDTATDDFYREKRTDQEIDLEIQEEKEAVAAWKQEKTQLLKEQKAGKPLEATLEQVVWEWFETDIEELLPPGKQGEHYLTTAEIRSFLNDNCGWDDNYLWRRLLAVCDDHRANHERAIIRLNKEKVRNQFRLAVAKKLGNIPAKDELDRLLRYEGAIERQLYNAMNQLERVQRLRMGDQVPAPVEVDVDVNTDQNQVGGGFVS